MNITDTSASIADAMQFTGEVILTLKITDTRATESFMNVTASIAELILPTGYQLRKNRMEMIEKLRRLKKCSECKCKPVISASKGIVCPICGKQKPDEKSWNEVNDETGNAVQQ